MNAIAKTSPSLFARANNAVGLALVSIILTVSTSALANDLTGVDNADLANLGTDRTTDLSMLGDLVVTGMRLMEDYVAPLMGVGLLVGAVNMGARHGDLMGALRYGMGAIFAFGIPWLVEMGMAFGA